MPGGHTTITQTLHVPQPRASLKKRVLFELFRVRGKKLLHRVRVGNVRMSRRGVEVIRKHDSPWSHLWSLYVCCIVIYLWIANTILHGPIFGPFICVIFWYMHIYMCIYEYEYEILYWYSSWSWTWCPMVPFLGPVYVLCSDICIHIWIYMNVNVNLFIDILVIWEHDSPWSHFLALYTCYILIYAYVYSYISMWVWIRVLI